MQESARGIILRVYPLTESSLIVHWLTAEHGRLATVAKGARKQKSSFAGKLDIFHEASFAFVRSRKSHLHTLAEVQIENFNSFLRLDLPALTQAAYCAALVEQTTEQETPMREASALLKEMLQLLEAGGGCPTLLLLWELLWLEALGQQPEAEAARLSPEARRWFESALKSRWAALQMSSPAIDRELASFLHGFLIYHLGKVPQNRGRALGFK